MPEIEEIVEGENPEKEESDSDDDVPELDEVSTFLLTPRGI